MISKKDIEEFLVQEFSGSEVFLVDIQTRPGNNIRVFVDSYRGITVNECSEISRLITGHFDRDVEDYSLDVSSPGLDMPLMVADQFKKNLGREIKVEMKDGKKRKGILKTYREAGIGLEETRKEHQEGKKKAVKITETVNINFVDIKTVKVVISFK